jgi:hypothetical protein
MRTTAQHKYRILLLHQTMLDGTLPMTGNRASSANQIPWPASRHALHILVNWPLFLRFPCFLGHQVALLHQQPTTLLLKADLFGTGNAPVIEVISSSTNGCLSRWPK